MIQQARAASEDATNARQLGYLKAASKGAMANASEVCLGSHACYQIHRGNGLGKDVGRCTGQSTAWPMQSGTMVTLRPRGSDSHAQAWDTGASEEDEDLSRAIAASLAQNGGRPTSCGHADGLQHGIWRML